MKDLIEIHWTCGSLDEARRMARFLVQEKMAASAQIIPWIEAVSMLDNQLETVQETKVILKTIWDNLDQIQDIILQNSKYEIPEITWLRIESNLCYNTWIEENIKKSVQE